MSIHQPIIARQDGAQAPAETVRRPDGGGISPRGRLAVIASASLWLWAGIATIGYYALR